MLPLESSSCSHHLWFVPSHPFHPPAIFVLFHSCKFELIKCSRIMQGLHRTEWQWMLYCISLSFQLQINFIWGLWKCIIPLGNKFRYYLIQASDWFLIVKKKILMFQQQQRKTRMPLLVQSTFPTYNPPYTKHTH